MDNRDTRPHFIDAIREARPAVTYVHSEVDHPDHGIASRVARDGRIPVSVPMVSTRFRPPQVRTTFVMDAYQGRHLEPEVSVDVSAVFETKKAMLAAHARQSARLESAFGTDLSGSAGVQSRFHGAQAGCEHPEAFRLPHDWTSSGDWRLLP